MSHLCAACLEEIKAETPFKNDDLMYHADCWLVRQNATHCDGCGGRIANRVAYVDHDSGTVYCTLLCRREKMHAVDTLMGEIAKSMRGDPMKSYYMGDMREIVRMLPTDAVHTVFDVLAFAIHRAERDAVTRERNGVRMANRRKEEKQQKAQQTNFLKLVDEQDGGGR